MKKNKNISFFILFCFAILKFITVSYCITFKVVTFNCNTECLTGALKSHFVLEGTFKKMTLFFKKASFFQKKLYRVVFQSYCLVKRPFLAQKSSDD